MGKSTDTTVTTQPNITPEEQAVRQELGQRLLGPELLPSSLARVLSLERLSRVNEPAPLDPRTAGILSVFAPQITAAQNAQGELLGNLLGHGVIPQTRDAVLSPFARFQDVVGGTAPPPFVKPATNDLAMRIGDLLLSALRTRVSQPQPTQTADGSAAQSGDA